MKLTLVLLEFRLISKGIAILDEISKNFNVNIEISRLVCPGRYMIICSGLHGEVESLSRYIESLEDNGIYKILVSGVGLNILNKVNKAIVFPNSTRSLGIIELSSSVKAIEVADFIEDMSPVEVLTIRLGVGMFNKGIIIFEGDISGIKNCLKQVEKVCEKELLGAEQINSPSREFLEKFKI